MAEVTRRHPPLNLPNVEATAAARLLGARVLLSPPASRGFLPAALTDEDICWDIVEPA
ncbi:MAG: hypothetical protein MUP67_09785 [Acidimicrobiia bacterium]|nr:hypothetical protein [Acidimicrobiia bacterium]